MVVEYEEVGFAERETCWDIRQQHRPDFCHVLHLDKTKEEGSWKILCDESKATITNGGEIGIPVQSLHLCLFFRCFGLSLRSLCWLGRFGYRIRCNSITAQALRRSNQLDGLLKLQSIFSSGEIRHELIFHNSSRTEENPDIISRHVVDYAIGMALTIISVFGNFSWNDLQRRTCRNRALYYTHLISINELDASLAYVVLDWLERRIKATVHPRELTLLISYLIISISLGREANANSSAFVLILYSSFDTYFLHRDTVRFRNSEQISHYGESKNARFFQLTIIWIDFNPLPVSNRTICRREHCSSIKEGCSSLEPPYSV